MLSIAAVDCGWLTSGACVRAHTQVTADAAEYKAGFDKAAVDAVEMKAGFDKLTVDVVEQKIAFDGLVVQGAVQKAQLDKARALTCAVAARAGSCWCCC